MHTDTLYEKPVAQFFASSSIFVKDISVVASDCDSDTLKLPSQIFPSELVLCNHAEALNWVI